MTVYLVGAGPGDPGLLTVRGRDLLEAADAVLYDGLVDGRVLDYTARDCLRLDVGKVARPLGQDGRHRPAQAPRAHAPSQDAINDLLVDCGRRYDCVVRLKGGDPFVFGRGGEEALALARAGIPFEVVPGVSSAVAVPACAGIPVTHRGLSASVAFVAGHEAPDKPAAQAEVDWSRLATAVDTLVILMGVGRLPAIVARLIDGGRDPQSPAAVVERGSTATQRVIAGPLGDLAELAAAAGVRSPAVVVVGDVAALARPLSWWATSARFAEEAAQAAEGRSAEAPAGASSEVSACA